MKVFFSYSRKDAGSTQLQSLKQDLEEFGVEVSIDRKEPGGAEWWAQVLHDIRHCDVFVLAVTSASLDSRPCQAELQWACVNGRTVLPVRVHAVADWNLGEALGAAQVVDYTRRDGTPNEAVRCVMDLRAAIEHAEQHPADPPPDVAPDEPDVPFPIANKLETYVRARTLTLHKQEEFLRQVRLHRDDVDADRITMLEVLTRFRDRPDIAMSVYRDVDGLIADLANRGAVAPDPGPTSGPPGPAPSGPADGARPGVRGAPGPENGTDQHAPGAAHEPDGQAAPDPYAGFSVSRFPAPGLRVDALAASLVNLYEEHHLEAQTHRDDDRVIVQCRSTKWSRRVGAGAALTVVLALDGDTLVVRVGGARWLDKAAAGAVAWFIAWPAIIPAAVGGRLQAKLPHMTLDHIEKEIPVLTQVSTV